MKENKITILQPDYYGKFHCLAGACVETCCNPEWQVTIDRDTYQKYKLIHEDQPLYQEVQVGVKKLRKNASKETAALIVMNDQGRCPFQNESGLCLLQKEYGEDYLCDTCRYYPRISYAIDQVVHRSLDISCEAAAQLILCQKDGIGFEQIQEENNSYFQSLPRINAKYSDPGSSKRHLIAMRTFAIDLMQNRSFPIYERMIVLGMAMKSIQNAIDNKGTDQIPAILKQYDGGNLPREALASPLKAISYRRDLRTYVCHGILSTISLPISVIKKNRVFERLQTLTNTGLVQAVTHQGVVSPEDFEAAALKFEQVYQEMYLPFEAKHGYMMENFLVNRMFNISFPCDKEDNLYQQYLHLVYSYLFTQMILVNFGLTAGKLDEETALLAFGFVSRHFHHAFFFTQVAEVCQEAYHLDKIANVATALKEPQGKGK